MGWAGSHTPSAIAKASCPTPVPQDRSTAPRPPRFPQAPLHSPPPLRLGSARRPRLSSVRPSVPPVRAIPARAPPALLPVRRRPPLPGRLRPPPTLGQPPPRFVICGFRCLVPSPPTLRRLPVACAANAARHTHHARICVGAATVQGESFPASCVWWGEADLRQGGGRSRGGVRHRRTPLTRHPHAEKWHLRLRTTPSHTPI